MTDGGPDLCVWLVDDDENDQFFVHRCVDHSVIRVSLRCFPTAQAAMTELQSPQCLPPDLIVCDMKMPELSGDSFVRWLRSTQHRSIPVVVRSTSDLETDVVAAYESGANAFVKKGMNLQKIQYNIGHIVQFGLMLKRSQEHASVSPARRWEHDHVTSI